MYRVIEVVWTDGQPVMRLSDHDSPPGAKSPSERFFEAFQSRERLQVAGKPCRVRSFEPGMAGFDAVLKVTLEVEPGTEFPTFAQPLGERARQIR